jgi:WD40 repeat protein
MNIFFGKSRVLIVFLSICMLVSIACSVSTTPTAAPEKTAVSVPSTMPQPTTAPTEPAASPQASPAMSPSATTAPAPTATPPQPPLVINAANAAKVQVIRDYNLDYGNGDITILTSKFSNDTQWLAVGGVLKQDKTYQTILRLTNVDSGKATDLEFVSPVINQLAFSPDDKLLAVAGCDLSLYLVGVPDTVCDQPRVWLVDTATGKAVASFKDYHSNVTSMVFSPDSKYLYTGIRYSTQLNETDNVIRVYDTTSLTMINKIVPKVSNCTDVNLEIAPDGRYLIVDVAANCGFPQVVTWFELSGDGNARLISTQKGKAHSLNPDESRILLFQVDGSFLEVDMQTGQRTAFYGSGSRFYYWYTYLADGKSVFFNGVEQDGAKILDATTGKLIRMVAPATYTYGGAFSFSPDMRTLVTFGQGKPDNQLVKSGISIWDTATWQETPLTSYIFHPLLNPYGSQINFSPDGSRLALTDGREVIIWGFAIAEQDQARQALLDYLGLLAGGKYAEAAKQFSPDNLSTMESDYLKTLISDADLSNIPTVLQALCQDPSYPCLPVKDMLIQSQIESHSYLFVIENSLPDGTKLPACKKKTAKYSWPDGMESGQFTYTVTLGADGQFKVLGFPPALALREPDFCPKK